MLEKYSAELGKNLDEVYRFVLEQVAENKTGQDIATSLQTRYPGLATKDIEQLVVAAAFNGMNAHVIVADVKDTVFEQLTKPWDPSGLSLSEKVHGVDQYIHRTIAETIDKQIRANKKVMEIARSLYDGYGYGNTVIPQDIPKYLQAVRHMSPGNLGTIVEARKAARRVEKLSLNGAPNQALKAAYKKILAVAENGTKEAMDKAVYVAINEKARYVSERIARTEAAKAWADGFYSKALEDKHVVGFQWRLGSRHPAFDICDVYAKADMFNLGKGIYPKDKVPPLPVHPHCLCRVSEVYRGEVDLSNTKDNADKAVSDWLNGLTDKQRRDVLGVKGAEEFGKTGKWQGNLRGWQGLEDPRSRLDFGLSLDEKGAILKYISSEAYTLNEKLRNGTVLSTDEQHLVDTLDAALVKMPKYSGIVGRSLYFNDHVALDKFIKKHTVQNKNINFKQYISSTSAKEFYNPESQIEVILTSKTGRDIRFFNAGEQEVLFERSARFRFLKRSDKDRIYLYYEEV